MGLNTDLLNNTSVREAEDALVAVFEGSDIDCRVGTTVRELVIRPMAVLRAEQLELQTNFLNTLNLYNIAEGAEADDDFVDALASTYRVKRHPSSAASGTAVFYLEDGNTVTYVRVDLGLYAGDVPLEILYTYIGVPNVSEYEDTDTVKYVPIREKDGNYFIVVPVQTQDTGVVNPITTGTVINITGPVNNISSAAVLSAIAGGKAAEDNQSLANRILYGVPNGMLATPLQIKNAFVNDFSIVPDSVAVIGTGSSVLSRALNPLTGIAQEGFVDVYVNTENSYAISYISAQAIKTDTGYKITILPEEAAGVYDVSYISVDNIGTIDTFDVKYTVGSNTGSHKVDAASVRYSAYQQIEITFAADNEEPELTCSVAVRFERKIRLLQEYVDSSDRKYPGQDTLIKAAVPCFLTLRFTVKAIDTTYDLTELKNAVVTHVNSLPTGKGFIDGQDIVDSLKDYNVQVRFPINMTGSFILPDKTHTVTTTNARLDCPSWPEYHLTPDVFAFFTDLDNVEITVEL